MQLLAMILKREYEPELEDVIDWSNEIKFPNTGEQDSWEQMLAALDARMKWLKSQQTHQG